MSIQYLTTTTTLPITENPVPQRRVLTNPFQPHCGVTNNATTIPTSNNLNQTDQYIVYNPAQRCCGHNCDHSHISTTMAVLPQSTIIPIINQPHSHSQSHYPYYHPHPHSHSNHVPVPVPVHVPIGYQQQFHRHSYQIPATPLNHHRVITQQSQPVLFTHTPAPVPVTETPLYGHGVQVNHHSNQINVISLPPQLPPLPIPVSNMDHSSNSKPVPDLKDQSSHSTVSSTTTAKEQTPFKDDDNGKEYKCVVCGRLFENDKDLSVHNNVHVQNSLFCRYCGVIFNAMNKLREHLKIHTKHCPWKCQFCDRSFKQKHSLKDHIRTHTGERPFKCDFCPRAFKVKHNLTSHRRLHTGERPFVCQLCPKKFASKSSLNGHTRKKHPEHWRLKKLVH